MFDRSRDSRARPGVRQGQTPWQYNGWSVAGEANPAGQSDRDRRLVGLRGWLAGARALLSNAIFLLSPKARFALGLAFLAVVLLGISALLSLPSAPLKLVCRHDSPSADLPIDRDSEVRGSKIVAAHELEGRGGQGQECGDAQQDHRQECEAKGEPGFR